FRALPEPLALKGKSKPVPAWEALGNGGRPLGALATAAPRAPFVGRRAELAQLRDVLARVERRRGTHLATIIGEPGVGKSRLLRRFEHDLGERDLEPLVRYGRSLPYGSSTVYWPLGEVIRAECAIVDDDPPELAW